jgi:hypothetical protein
VGQVIEGNECKISHYTNSHSGNWSLTHREILSSLSPRGEGDVMFMYQLLVTGFPTLPMAVNFPVFLVCHSHKQNNLYNSCWWKNHSL